MAGVRGSSPSCGFIHRLDPRWKLAALALLAGFTAFAGLKGLAPLSLPVLVSLFSAGKTVHPALRDLKWFPAILAFLFLSRAFFTPGPPLFSLFGAAVAARGLAEGVVVCWRLSLVVLASVMVAATTRIIDLRAAIRWYLRPVPFIPEKQASVMLGLMVRFIPMIVHRTKSLGFALSARCVGNRKNPVYRMRVAAAPLLTRLFLTSDRVAMAMTARCHVDDPTEHPLQTTLRDMLAMAAVLAACLLSIAADTAVFSPFLR